MTWDFPEEGTFSESGYLLNHNCLILIYYCQFHSSVPEYCMYYIFGVDCIQGEVVWPKKINVVINLMAITILKCPIDDIQPLNIQISRIAFQRFLILAQLLSFHIPSNKSCQTLFHTSPKKDPCEVMYPFSTAIYLAKSLLDCSCSSWSISLCEVYKQKRTGNIVPSS